MHVIKRADTALGIFPFPWLFLDIQSKETFFANSHASLHVSRRQLLLFSIPELNLIAHNNYDFLSNNPSETAASSFLFR